MSTIDGMRLARLAVQKVADRLSEDYHIAEEAGADMALDAIDAVIALYTEMRD
jgi:hypothetical protein